MSGARGNTARNGLKIAPSIQNNDSLRLDKEKPDFRGKRDSRLQYYPVLVCKEFLREIVWYLCIESRSPLRPPHKRLNCDPQQRDLGPPALLSRCLGLLWPANVSVDAGSGALDEGKWRPMLQRM